MKSKEIASILKEGNGLESKLKELLTESEQNKADITAQEQEIATEHEQTKQLIEEFEQKLAEVFSEWKKAGLFKDKVIFKQKELIKEIKRRTEEQSRIYIKEYTELYTATARQKKELKAWAEKQQHSSREEIKKVKRLVWIVGVVIGVVSMVLTMLGCYLVWGRK